MRDIRPSYRGEELKTLRHKHHITQEQLAHALGAAENGNGKASRALVSHWEIDKVKFPPKYLKALIRLQEAPTVSRNLGLISTLTPARKYAIQEVAKIITTLEKDHGIKNGIFEIMKGIDYIRQVMKEYKRVSQEDINQPF